MRPTDRDYLNEICKYLLATSLQFLPESIIEQFKKLETGHQRVDFAYNYMALSPMVHDMLFPRKVQKCNKKSLKLREEGNEMFRDKKGSEALLLYTKSIAYAETGSSYLGLAYGNRSAVLFEKGYYKECLEDIDRALESHYPHHLKQKLLARQKRANTLKTRNNKSFKYYEPAPNIPTRHPNILSASDCIELKKNETFGTHVVTTRNVKAGEVLSVEKPFVLDVVTRGKYRHCYECLELCFNMIPCENCATALYCSKSCRLAAFTFYHRYECDFGSTIEDKLLAVKTTLLCAIEQKLGKNGYDTDDGFLRSDRYKEVYNLETNEPALDKIHFFMSAVLAGIVFHCFKKRTNFITENQLDENMLKGTIFRNVLIEGTNSVEIEKVKYFPGSLGAEPTPVGRGLYSFTSRYNHSCAPNCLRISHGTSFVIRALQDIGKGEQCTVTYGSTYYKDSFNERQSLLKMIFSFTCRCVACENSWPMYDHKDANRDFLEMLRDFFTHGGCNAGGSAKQLCQMLVTISKDVTKLNRNEILSKCYQLQKLLVEPCKALVYLRTIIHHVFDLAGNRDIQF